MNRLNEDCLLQIFKHMELSEQLNMARVCIRFRNVVREILKSEFTSIDIINPDFYCPTELFDLNSAQIKILIQLVAPNLKRLNILNANKYSYLSSISFYSKLNLDNLVELSLSGIYIDDDHVELLAHKCKQLHTFSLCSPQAIGHSIAKMGQLKNLRLHYCLAEQNVSRVRSIRNFSFFNCRKTKSDTENWEWESLCLFKCKKLTICTFNNMIYFRSIVNYFKYNLFLSMSLSHLMMYIIKNCKQLENIATVFNKRRLPKTELDLLIFDLEQQDRSLRVSFYTNNNDCAEEYQNHLQKSTIYKQQNKFKIEFLHFEDHDIGRSSLLSVFVRKAHL